MKTLSNPSWWTQQHDSGWERVKAAFQRDWDQTKHDFGGKNPDTDQDADNTVKQAAGKEAIPPRGERTYEDVEPAYRFGYGARSQYGKNFSQWDGDLEMELRRDWETTYPESDWDRHVRYVRRGWEYPIPM
jgi:hypothetical protein